MENEYTIEFAAAWMIAAGYTRQTENTYTAKGECIPVPTEFFRATIDGTNFEVRVDVNRDWDHGVHMWQWARCTNQKYIRFHHHADEASFVAAVRKMEQVIRAENAAKQ